ncbi:hypothetical protein [Microbacterium sp. T32]|uniref:hypothetical protein n=1 Tax=Microbacterium sp. T32 TaxID=1776083 RepID=UPI0007AC00F1|nr:hypothetical protein [Microbacterium sp. T32]KZE41427.1 hypothetical protein AVW09_02225 [Microbacterium sp. T32]
MGSILPNAVWLPGPEDPIDWHITPSIMGAAADAAIAGRSDSARARRRFVATAADVDAVKATEGLAPGDQIYRSDLKLIETLGSAGWRVTRTIAAQSYTPDWATNSAQTFRPGNGQQAWCYWVDGKVITVTGVLIFGSTTDFGSTGWGPTLPTVPGYPAGRILTTSLWGAGEAIAQIGGTIYRGAVTSAPLLSPAVDTPRHQIIFRDASRVTRWMGPTFPATWGQNSVLSVTYQYETTA